VNHAATGLEPAGTSPDVTAQPEHIPVPAVISVVSSSDRRGGAEGAAEELNWAGEKKAEKTRK